MTPPTDKPSINRESADFIAGYAEGYHRVKSWVCDACYRDLP